MTDSFTPDGQNRPIPQPPSATPADPEEGPNPLDPVDEVFVIPDEPGAEE